MDWPSWKAMEIAEQDETMNCVRSYVHEDR